MMSLQAIQALSDEKTKKAKKQKLTPYIATCDNDENVFKCPFLGFYLPKGYKVVNTYFVDNSGFGSDNEPALTASQFLNHVRKGYGYAVREAGQFQVYILEYEYIGG